MAEVVTDLLVARPRPGPPVAQRRCLSLDVLRGATIALMIVVENQGDGAHTVPGLAHARWDGLGAADLVFPLFLFMVGGSMAFALDGCPWGRILRRTGVLFFLGLVLNGLGRVPLGELAWVGVLQRIALCYLLAAVAIRVLSVRQQAVAAGLVLVGYWAFLAVHPLGPEGYGDGWLFDPSGLASTPSAAVNVLAGYWALRWLRVQPAWQRAAGSLARVGVACVVLGAAWGFVHPVNKRLWTGSFVVVTVGLALLALAAAFLVVDVRERRRFAWAFEVFGRNAVVLYVASELVSEWLKDSGAREWLYRHLFVPWAGMHVGSLAYSLVFVGLWWVVLYALWRRRWFVSV
jgi:predicted acyltransferase